MIPTFDLDAERCFIASGDVIASSYIIKDQLHRSRKMFLVEKIITCIDIYCFDLFIYLYIVINILERT